MPHLSPVSWKKFEAFLKHVGCVYIRQKGSHRIYTRADLKRPLVVPVHGNITIVVIRSNLRTLGISPEQYLEDLKKI